MVLKKWFVSDPGEDYALHVHCQGHSGDRGHQLIQVFTWKMFLKMQYFGGTEKTLLFRFIVQVLWKRALQDDKIVLLRRWS